MKKVLVITTRDLPEIPIHNNEGLYHLILSEKLDAYTKSQNEGMPQNIGEYLKTYDRNTGSVKKSVEDNLECYVEQNKTNCKIPILKREVNESLLIYVTLCLSKDFSGYGDEICHGYIKAIIDDVEADVNNEKVEYYLLAHSMDIVREQDCKGLGRLVSTNELKIEDLKTQIKQVNIFCHEDDDKYHKGIICHLSDEIINIDEVFKVLNG